MLHINKLLTHIQSMYSIQHSNSGCCAKISTWSLSVSIDDMPVCVCVYICTQMEVNVLLSGHTLAVLEAAHVVRQPSYIGTLEIWK